MIKITINKELLKKIGTIGIFLLIGFLIWGLTKISSLTLTGEDLAFILVIFFGIILVVYYLINYFTGAKVSDVSAIKKLLQQLLGEKEEVVNTQKDYGDLQSDSSENST